MEIKEVLKVAWKSINANKSRALLTMLGVIIGVAAVIIMMAVSAGTEATIAEQIEGLGSNLLFINSSVTRGSPGGGGGGGQSGLTFDDYEAIKERISGIAGTSVEMQTTQDIKYESATLEDITVVGATPDYPTVRVLEIGDGRFINDTEMDRDEKVVVLGSDIAAELFGAQDPVGQSVTIGTTKFTVIGIMAEKGIVSGTNFDEQIYVPISVIFQKFLPSMFARFMGDSVRTIYVSVEDDADKNEVINQITLLLYKMHDVSEDDADFTIQTQEDIIETQESTTASFRTLLSWVASVSLIVGGIGIMNIMLVSVTERTREIGIRQSIGATPKDIRMQFLTEALILSLMGGLLGIFAGIGGSFVFGATSDMRTVIVPWSILLSFCSSAFVGIFFGYVPANQASKLDPIEALRYE